MKLKIVSLSWVRQYCQFALLCFCLVACENSLAKKSSQFSQVTMTSMTEQNFRLSNKLESSFKRHNNNFLPIETSVAESNPTSTNATQLLRIGNDEYSAIKLGEDKFEDNNWEERWYLESSDAASVSVAEGQLRTDVAPGSSGTGINLWYKGYNKSELPKDILVRFKAKSLIEGDEWLQLIMLNTNVRRADNSEYILGTFDGKDSDYQNNLRTYRTSFNRDALVLRITPPRTNLVFEDKATVVETNKQIEFVVAVHNGRIRGYIDGVKLFDVAHSHPEYKSPFEGGKVGIRTNKSQIVWDDFEFYELLP